MARFVLLLALILPVAANAQSIQLNWSADGQRCWFERSSRSGQTDFVVVSVDAPEGSRSRPAFDRTKLAEAIARVTGEAIAPTTLNVDRIAFADSAENLFVRAKRQFWRVNLKTYELEKKSPPAGNASSRFFMPPRRSGPSERSTNISIENRLKESIDLFWIDRDGRRQKYGSIQPNEVHQQHTYVGHVWSVRTLGRSCCFSARPGDRVVIDDAALDNVNRASPARTSRQRRTGQFATSLSSPDGKWEVVARDHNLWLRSDDGEKPLTTDGSEGNSYARTNGRTPSLPWSTNSEYVIAFQTRPGTQRTVYMVESTPRDQLQPRLQSYGYRKPGDDLDAQTVHLFAVRDRKEIPVSHELLANPWTLRFAGWSKSGDRFYLRYNQRGHQVVRLLEVSVPSGQVRTIVEETSKTFIHYSTSGKSVFEDLSDDEFLWASERSGWNHLYRYSRSERKLLNAVTSGDWNVKRIERIDHDTRRIWFYAVGVHNDQDPYHEHFCRVNFDGSDFRILTTGDGTHRVRFEQDDRYLIDTFSRVDMAPVTELRDAENGALIAGLSRADTKARFGKRRLTERFVAKGRDGKTDIWGIIHWPANFDSSVGPDGQPTTRYPVVENIYAGPHDHHVPKAFRTRYGHQHRIADAGMIVVQIDGMGTAWRSREFHDVCYKNLRDAGFPDRIAWLKAASKEFPQMDLSRVGIYGGSAGGQNAMAALLWHNDFYKVAVADCGCHDNRMDKIWWNEQWMGWPVDDSYKQNSNMENAHLLKGDLMLIVGELDRNVDPATTTQVVSRLVKANKDFEFVLVPGTGHGSAETRWASRKRLNFLREKLGATPSE